MKLIPTIPIIQTVKQQTAEPVTMLRQIRPNQTDLRTERLIRTAAVLKQAAAARAEILLKLNRTFSESDYAFRFANSFQQAFTGV